MHSHLHNTDLLDTLLYFYSTTPQVLGAILAISGAFVVIKIDSLKQGIYKGSQQIFDMSKGNQDERTILDESFDYEEIKALKYSQLGEDFKRMEEVIDDKYDSIKSMEVEEYRGNILENCKVIKEGIKSFGRFIKKTKRTYIGNGTIIVVLLAGFFAIPEIYSSKRLYWVTLIIGWILTTVSLTWIISYLISSFRKRQT